MVSSQTRLILQDLTPHLLLFVCNGASDSEIKILMANSSEEQESDRRGIVFPPHRGGVLPWTW
jgi:hypothetical protein